MPKRRKNKKKRTLTKNVVNNEEEEKNDLIKITNIDYENFAKINEKLFDYILKSKPPIIIYKDEFNSEINLQSDSLIKIIKKGNLENKFKIYLTLQIVSEKINFETYSSNNLSFNPNAQNYINEIKKFNVIFPVNNKNILLDKKSLQRIFSFINMNYTKDIYNYIVFFVTQISYKYEKNKLRLIKAVNNLKKFLEENKIFYFYPKNKSDIPLSNYSTKKIFNLINEGEENKNLLINYKIKNQELIEKEENNKIFLDKIINASDIKNILMKYNNQTKNKEFKLLNSEKLEKIEEINITDLDNFLLDASSKLSDILTQISNKKEEIIKSSEKIINQIILINIDGKNKFINKQYLQLIDTKNLFSIDSYDIKNEKITFSKKTFGKIEEENIYLEIKYENKKYLIQKNILLKIYDSWKILNQSEIIDVIEIDEFNKVKINFELLNINIIEQNIIKDINEESLNKEKNNIFEYVKNLPPKKVYKIKYKVKVTRVPKDKNKNNSE